MGTYASMSMRALVALLLITAMPFQVLAATETISSAQLTEGSLLGQIQSTAQLQHEFDAHSALIAQATEELGLTRDDYLAVRRAIALGQARYVVIPRHLDGMAGQHDGEAFTVKNVTIPAGVHGWEVDLPKPEGMVRVFVPNACGNVSYLRTNKRYRVAAAYIAPPVAVAAAPLPTPAPIAIATEAPQAIATAVPVAVVQPMAAAPSAPHLAWLGLLLLPIIAGLGGGGGGGSGGNRPHTASAAPTPIPIHTICPTLSIRIP